jgi:hypothetical protein
VSRTVRVVLTFAAIVVLFDAIGAFAARTLDFDYSVLSIGSWFIYAAAGFFAAERSRWVPGILAGATTGLADATLGWWVSWLIGPGRPAGEWNALMLMAAAISVVITASLVGLLGAVVRQLVPLGARSTPLDASRPPA